MAPYSRRKLTLVWAVTMVVALPVITQHAAAQRFGRGPRGDSAQSDRSRDGADNGGFRSRRGSFGRPRRTPDGESDQPASRGNDRTAGGRERSTGGTTSNSSTRSTSANRSAADSDRLRTYAKRLVERYDKNGNMMLEADERARLQGRPAKADLNDDDVITIDELVIHLSASPSGTASSGSSGSTPSGASSFGTTGRSDRTAGNTSSARQSAGTSQASSRRLSGGSSSAKNGDAKRKSYRFTPPTERLPAGLPSWFKSRDANGDGQVAMHEFSRSWNDRTAADFQRQDKNNDGFIAPDEAAR